MKTLTPQESVMKRNFLIQRQSLPLHLKIQMSTRRIIEFYEHYNGNVFVSFSGGKDSTVLLHLIRSIYPNIEAVFVDTGLEYPEIRNFVKTVPNVTILRPEMPFHKVITKYGYPVVSKEVSDTVEQARKTLARGDGKTTIRLQKIMGTLVDNEGRSSIFNCSKWKFLLDAPFEISNKCCDIMKKKPCYKYEKETGKKGYIGTLASESRLRTTLYLRYGCNAFNAKRPHSTPLGFWTEQDILEYLAKYDVPYCNIYGDILKDDNGKYYTTGATRTGCMFCMFGCQVEKSPNRFERMKISHPKQYDYCINKLGCGKVLDFLGVKY